MDTTNIANELLALEKEYWQAIKDKNAETAMRLSDDPCIVTGAQGVASISRQSLGDMMKSAPYVLNDFKVSDDVQVRVLDENAAVLAYEVHEELVVDGKQISLDASDASTWVRRDGKWLCALHTESITGDPFGRDRRRSRA